ncbi:MAG: hypothetical protein AB1405_06530 [Bdellovibrionota bacterium]
MYQYEFRENPGALLEYLPIGGEWTWRGPLLKKPQEADAFSRMMQAAVEELLPDARIHRISLLPQSQLEIEADAEERSVGPTVGFASVHVLPRGTKEPAPASRKGRLFVPIEDGSLWKDFPSKVMREGDQVREGMLRALHSAAKDSTREGLMSMLFEKEGHDLLIVSSDGHRMTVHRLVGWAHLTDLSAKAPKTVLALTDDLKSLIRRAMKGAGEVFFQVLWKQPLPGEADPFGALVLDGQEFSLSLRPPEVFPNWREVPKNSVKIDWECLLNGGEVLAALEAVQNEWKKKYAQVHKTEAKSKDIPQGLYCTLSSKGFTLGFETPAKEQSPGTPESLIALTVPVGELRGARKEILFAVTPRYLKEALSNLAENVVLAGSLPETAWDKNSPPHVQRPLAFLDAAGPTEIFLMPRRI